MRILLSAFIILKCFNSAALAQDLSRFSNACSPDKPYACIELGDEEMARNRFSKPPGPDYFLALAYFEVACDADSAKACKTAADISSRKLPKKTPTRDLEPAFTLYKKACALGAAESCLIAGSFATNQLNQSYIPDPAAAAKLLDRGCTLGEMQACRKAFMLYSRDQISRKDPSKSVGKDEAKALEYRIKACDLGDRKSCRYLK